MRKYSEVMVALKLHPSRGELLVRRALKANKGHLGNTAAALDIHQTTLSRVLRERPYLRKGKT
jgi:ActR/RegA family two-component response regulator